MKKIVLFFLLFVSAVSIYAKTWSCRGGYCFDCYDRSLNLPQNQVEAFFKDSQGYMFIAGKNFLVRFDGREFVLPGGSRLAGIPTNTINDFVADGSGTGYIATDLGLWTKDLENFGKPSFKNIGKVGNLSVKSLAYDKKKALVFGAVRGKGIFSLSSRGFIEWFNPESSRLGTKNVEKVFADSIGNIWLGTVNGVYLMRAGSENFVQIDYLEDSVSAFAEGAENVVFAGGRNGLYVIEKGEVSVSFTGNNIPFSDITALESEDSGKLWIGTKNSGIFLFDGSTFSPIRGMESSGSVTAFVRDGEGEMWFGTSAEGFCIAKRSAFKEMIFESVSVSGVVSDSAGNIFVNTPNGIVRLGTDGDWELFNGELLSSSVFDRIFFDKADNLWVSDSSGLFIMQPDRTFKPVKEIYTSEDDLFPVSADVFFSDEAGNVWVNDRTLRGALFVFRNDKTAERFLLPDSDAGIVDIVEYDGRLFIVTKRSGVFELEETGVLRPVALWKKEIFVKRTFVDSKQRIWIITLSDEIFIVTEKDAVTFPVAGIRGESAIHSISEDKNGNIWLMTNSGVAVIKGPDADCFISGKCSGVPVIVYGRKDGMSSVECAGGRISDAAVSSEGFLFVPMMKGVAVFDTNFRESGGFVPEIRIERVFSSDENQNYYPDDEGTVLIPQSLKNLSVSYSAPLFSGAGELFFDYSFDKEQFRGTTTDRTLVFSNIKSGLHEFSIRAYRSGNPSKFSEKKLVFQVKPAFYEKKWFLITVPLIFIFFVSILFFLDKRLRAIRQAEIKRLIDEKTAELQMKNNTLKEAVMKDPLTGLMNRRYMFDIEERKIMRFIESRDRKIHLMDNRNLLEKNDFVYGVIMMDIDHFKRVNDLYGHDAGDMVLKGVAEIMQDSVRADDILIRWGGEEFLIVLKNIPIKKMFEVAKKIRKAIEKHPFRMQSGTTLWITVSMGVVFLPFFAGEPKLMTFENIITLADLALYHSKHQGRDMATFVVPGENVPKNPEEVSGMLSSSEFAAVNGFYTFEKIEPDNFSEFEI